MEEDVVVDHQADEAAHLEEEVEEVLLADVVADQDTAVVEAGHQVDVVVLQEVVDFVVVEVVEAEEEVTAVPSSSKKASPSRSTPVSQTTRRRKPSLDSTKS